MNLGQRNKVSVTGNMSSMTDLVFLLLIFFVMLSTLVSRGVEIELPSSKGTTTDGARLTVTIDKDSQYFIDQDPMTRDQLEPELIDRMAQQKDKVLYLAVAKNVPTGKTVEIIGLAKAKEWKVMLGASPNGAQ